MASPGSAPGVSDSSDSDEGDGEGEGGTVLCTVLYKKGIMPEPIYEADSRYGASLPEDVVDGYLAWATPLADWMTKNNLLLIILTPFIMMWARHMAGERNTWGYLCEKVGIPMCKLINKIRNWS
jgi:hypothetical protein